jgi:RNA polymerase sigma factor (sigma-70 family)
MARVTNTVLGEVIRSAVGSDGSSDCDRELLGRFADAGDQAAFGTLFRRHSGMVLGVCRRALSNLQDAEDACQATFVVLARRAKSGRWQPSVANWLYTTARRVARNARLAAERRARREKKVAVPEAVQPVDRMTGRELLDILDFELDRLSPAYREPLVLCYLEGLTRDEAAARLGVPPASLKTRLERGRRRLGEALTKRGCVLGAGLLALAATSPAGATPLRLYQAVLAAAAGSPPDAVAKLAKGVAASGIGKSNWVGLVALVGAVVLGIGFATGRPVAVGQPPRDAMPAKSRAAASDRASGSNGAADRGQEITLKGTVFDTDGKPFRGAKLLLAGKGDEPVDLGVSDADGRFATRIAVDHRPLHVVAKAAGFGCDFCYVYANDAPVELHLVKDHAVRGRIVDTQGRPVPGASVHALEIAAYENESLDAFLVEWKKRDFFKGPPRARQHLREAPSSLFATTTDARGQFTLDGSGRERFVVLRLDGAGIADMEIQVLNREGFDPKPYNQATLDNMPEGFKKTRWLLDGPELAIVAELEKPIRGIVTAADTGKPRSGVDVWLTRNDRQALTPVPVKARTDASGRFAIRGARKAPAYMLEVQGDTDAAYMPRQVYFDDTIGYEPIAVDFRVLKGVIVTGHVRDRSTGEGIPGHVMAAVLAGNPYAKQYTEFHLGAHGEPMQITADDGAFRVVTIPGPVLLMGGAQGSRQQADGRRVPRVYKQPVPDPKYPQYFPKAPSGTIGYSYSCLYLPDGGGVVPVQGNYCRVLDIKPGTEFVEQDLLLEPSATLKVLVRDAAGKALTGARVAGTRPEDYFSPDNCRTDTCTVYDLQPGKTRLLVFFHPGQALAGTLMLNGDEKTPVIATLRPTGSVKGRLVGEDGKPLTGVPIDLKYRDRAAAEMHEDAEWSRQRLSGSDGSFLIETVIPGLAFDLSIGPSSRQRRKLTVALKPAAAVTVGPGETKDLGNVVVRPRAERSGE